MAIVRQSSRSLFPIRIEPRHRLTRGALAPLLTLSMISIFLAISARADAAVIHRDERTALSLGGLVRAGAFAEFDEADPVGEPHGFRVVWARLDARLSEEGIGGLHLQLEAARGTVELLDAVASVRPVDGFELRIGRFKTPVSSEFLLPAPGLLFASRAALVGWTQRRLVGAETRFELPLGDARLRAHLGLFQPHGFEGRASGGEFLAARTALELPVGLAFHAGVGEHVMTFADVPGDERPVAHDRQLDVAATLDRGAWHAHAEGLVILEGPDGRREFGAYTHLARQFDLGADRTLIGALGYDYLDGTLERFHRVRAALNLRLLHEHLVPRLAWHTTMRVDDVHHALFLGLQLGL